MFRLKQPVLLTCFQKRIERLSFRKFGLLPSKPPPQTLTFTAKGDVDKQKTQFRLKLTKKKLN